MKILVTGANGLLGQHLIQLLLTKTTHAVIASGKGTNRLPFTNERLIYQPADLAEPFDVYDLFDTYQPDIVVHAGALTQVDHCEENQEEAFKINYDGTCSVVVKTEEQKCFLIFISTDFVFDGSNGPYKEEDEVHDVNWYGQTKWMAENMVKESAADWAIVRTCLVYGNNLNDGRNNIINWVKENLEQGKKIKVVSDQFRTPTYVEDLAKGIVLIIQKKAKGIYHISGEEMMTPFDMAIATAAYLGLDNSLIEKVNGDTFSQPAKRPLKTGLIIDKAKQELGYVPCSFKDGLKRMLS